jgi:hypothetical protein
MPGRGDCGSFWCQVVFVRVSQQLSGECASSQHAQVAAAHIVDAQFLFRVCMMDACIGTHWLLLLRCNHGCDWTAFARRWASVRLQLSGSAPAAHHCAHDGAQTSHSSMLHTSQSVMQCTRHIRAHQAGEAWPAARPAMTYAD